MKRHLQLALAIAPACLAILLALGFPGAQAAGADLHSWIPAWPPIKVLGVGDDPVHPSSVSRPVDLIATTGYTARLPLVLLHHPPLPDLTHSSLVATPASVVCGERITYRLVLSNTGVLTARSQVTISLSGATAYVPGSLIPAGTYRQDDHQLLLSVLVSPLSAIDVTWQVTATDYASYTATVHVSDGLATPLTRAATTAGPRLSDQEQAGLDRVNNYRNLMGVLPTVANCRLTDGARKHAHYMILNWDAPRGHFEDPNLPGYTPEGDLAARNSDLFWGMPTLVQAVDGWMGSLGHRNWIMRPEWCRAGLAIEHGGDWRYAAVLDVLQGRCERSHDYPVVYPADGQTDVPVTGYDKPPPCQGLPGPVGYPVSIQFQIWEPPPTFSQVVWLDSANRPVTFCVQPADLAYNMMSMIPTGPLQSNERYTVSIAGQWRGASFARTWSFTTAGPAAQEGYGKDLAPRPLHGINVMAWW